MGTVNLGKVRDRVTGVERINGNGSAGTIDTYRVSFESSNYYDFNVTNGRNGVGQIISFSGNKNTKDNLIFKIVNNQDKTLALLIKSNSDSEINSYMQVSFKVEKTSSDYIVFVYGPTGSELFHASYSASISLPIVSFTFSSGFNEDYLNAWCLLCYNDSSTGLTIDDELSDSSTNPVQNKVVTGEFNKYKSLLELANKNNVRFYNNNIAIGITWVDNYFREYNTGNRVYNNTYCYSDFISCKPNTYYVNNLSNCHICFYDIDQNYLSGSTGGNFTTPNNCFYFIISIAKTDKDNINISTESIMSEVLRGTNTNLFSGITWVDNYFLDYSSGARIYNASYCYTNEYIPVGANNPIALGLSGCHICFYDINKTYISGNIVSGFTTPSNCAYMRVSIEKTKKTDAYAMIVKDDYIVLEDNGMFASLQNALDCANTVKKPLLIKGGTWDVSNVVGSGLYVATDIIGIGKPTIIANKDSFDINFSPINFVNKTNVKISGLKIVANNCRYCIHDEMGGNSANDYYTHIVENCELIQQTAIQQDFTYPRCIGIGLGNNGQIIINNCSLTSNVAEEIDVHTGYAGQTYSSEARITNCVMKTGTVSATSVNIGSDFKDIVIVSNCLVNAIPFVNTSSSDNVDLIAYNNEVII